MTENIWDEKYSAWITSFWGWSPGSWGTIGFTRPGRRNTIVRKTTDPFIMVIYVTKSAPSSDPDIRGKICGFYLVSHIEGHRDDFTSADRHSLNPEKWAYSLKAIRAFSFLPEYRLDIDKFDPTLGPRARSVAASGEEIDEAHHTVLRHLPYVEVEVFGGGDVMVGDIQVPDKDGHMVKAGPVNRGGYVVPGEPPDTEKELYALALDGDVTTFLGEPDRGRSIFKIGLSMSPKTRLEAFRKSLPRGTYSWRLHRSTRVDGHPPYPTFEAAEAGERSMKDYLGHHGRWLDGEFYAASLDTFEIAWRTAREKALAYTASQMDSS